MGFTNFYQCFIKGYSQVAAPLHALISCLNAHLHGWLLLHLLLQSSNACSPLHLSSQSLIPTDSSLWKWVIWRFVWVQFSHKGQRQIRVHESVFFLCLSQAERNYDAGDWELLAIKLALEDWGHWLEGSSHPFIVFTDYKNLKYLHRAKCFNSRQPRWCMFFTRFDFSLFYHPGSKNI